jgi:hypothetical protein
MSSICRATFWLTLTAIPLASAEETLPVYLDLVRQLKASDSVLPPVPDTHPVNTLSNPEAVVPPQCYTRTEARTNPCYVCHQDPISGRENQMADGELQQAYSFSEEGMINHWSNLFSDRSAAVKQISDTEIKHYVSQDNYSELPQRLRAANFQGWVPDLAGLEKGATAFDAQGFAKDGSHWIAFNYKPFPSTFWPTNGSTDDVMIRLPSTYRNKPSGDYSRDIYTANLAILEATIKGVQRIGCPPFNELEVGRDMDGDGNMTTISEITDVTHWVGQASDLPVESHLYPEGTEFLHTVRYLGLDQQGRVGISTRMKEVRYMWKAKGYSKPMYARKYQMEAQEKEAGNLPAYVSLGQHGLDNGNGWAIQGFIEDRKGRLRFLTHEENFSCMGCHNSVGSTIDKTFSFPRKVDGAAGWGYIDLTKMKDAPSKGETQGEFATYFQRVEGGSEFRNNDEMQARLFHPDGKPNLERIQSAANLYDLIVPSVERAVALNKAYWTTVKEQTYIFGKDAVLAPPTNVYDKIDNKTTPTLPPDKVYRYNILLDWPKVQ